MFRKETISNYCTLLFLFCIIRAHLAIERHISFMYSPIGRKDILWVKSYILKLITFSVNPVLGDTEGKCEGEAFVGTLEGTLEGSVSDGTFDGAGDGKSVGFS